MNDDPRSSSGLVDSPPPPPPRALNPVARRRSWGEPRVRTWWMMAIVVTAAMISIMGDRYLQARTAAYRVAHWYRIDNAKVVQINTSRRPTLVAPPGDTPPAILTYTDPQGRQHEARGTIHPVDEPIKMQQTIPILVDPNDTNLWTDRVTVEPLISRLALGFTLAPLWLLLVAGAIWTRQKMLRLWQNGRAEQAVVLDSRNTASAPLCRTVRCALQAGREDRLIQVVIPARHGTYSKGDVLWVILPPVGVSPALAARSYSP